MNECITGVFDLDLPTHTVFGLSIGLIFFGRPEIALLIGLGTLIPDLDREYWFIPVKVYREAQYHRALLHNVFVIALFYLVSPFLSLGIFLHMLLDSFTTSKDRGCEWFFPLSRNVKRGLYDPCKPMSCDLKEQIYFYHEDLHASIEYYPDPDDPQPPIPWRRVFGPALNSNLLDRGFLFGSIILIIVWSFLPDLSNLTLWSQSVEWSLFLIGYGAIAILFFAGELDRRDQEAPFRKAKLGFLSKISFLKYPIFVIGCLLFVTWLVLYQSEILANLGVIRSTWISLLVGGLLITISSFIILKTHTRKGKSPAIV